MTETIIKTAVIPHPDKILRFRKIQEAAGGIHLTPLFFVSDADFYDVSPEAFAVTDILTEPEGTVSLRAELTSDGRIFTLLMPLARSSSQQEALHSPSVTDARKIKMNVFQLASVKFVKGENFLEWQILKSRWIKLKD